MFLAESGTLERLGGHGFTEGFRISGLLFLELSAPLCPGLLNGHLVFVFGLHHGLGALHFGS